MLQHYLALVVGVTIGLLAARWGGPVLGAMPFTLGAITFCAIRLLWRPIHVPIEYWGLKSRPWKDAKTSSPGYTAWYLVGTGFQILLLLLVDLLTFLSR